MAKKTDRIVEMAHKKATDRQKEVMDAVKRMQKEGKKITFYSVMKETGASKSYLYTNKAIYDIIVEARDGQAPKTPRAAQSKDAIIKMQKSKIMELERKISSLQSENDESYKAKYQRVAAENQELKEQLRVAYSY